MSGAIERRRAEYESAVRGLRAEADDLLARGTSQALVAKRMVDRRNALKAEYRVGLDPALLTVIELRNVARYGHPLGPTAAYLRRRYGTWDAVIAAACRPADLSGGAGRVI